VDGNRTHQAPRKRRLNGFEDRGTHQASRHSLRSGDTVTPTPLPATWFRNERGRELVPAHYDLQSAWRVGIPALYKKKPTSATALVG